MRIVNSYAAGLLIFLALSGCERVPNTDPASASKPLLDGVYASLPSVFDQETLIIEGDSFRWWFASDSPTLDVFPLAGSIRHSEDRIELIYEIRGSELSKVASVFPPLGLRTERLNGVQVLRSIRFEDPFDDDKGAYLLPSTQKITSDRSDYPAILTDTNTSPEVRKIIEDLNQKTEED